MKFLKPQTDLNMDSIIDVTDVFRDSINQVVNQTGIMGRIDMTQAPFNTIEFWLQGTPVIRRRQSVLSVDMVDQHGNVSVYRYLFNADGIFQEMEGGALPSYIPLSTYSDMHRLVTLPEFLDLAHQQVPILTNVLAQDLFMKTHQIKEGQALKNVVEEMNKTIEFNVDYGGNDFKILFKSTVNKQNDLTLQTKNNFSSAQIQA